jgi:DNA-binding LacI/PurR family transcriptional regulator
MGRQAMYLILNEIQKKTTADIKLVADLVIRKSTGSPAVKG